MKSNKKCVFNVNFQYNHKQVPTAYFSVMFNIHKHISHLIFVLVPECGEWNLQSKNNIKVDFSSAAIFYWPFSSIIDRNRNRPFNLVQNKVGYHSCFAYGSKIWTIFMKQFWRYLNIKKQLNFGGDLLPTWLCIECDVFFFLTLSGISCVTILKYTLIKDVYLIYVLALILSPQFTKITEYKTSNQKRKSQIIIETNLLDM